MDNSKYEAVRAKVITLCPDLMEMTDGCRVRITAGAFDGKIFTFQKDTLRKMYDEFWTEGDSCGACAFSENEFEILGHTPRLSHVLRAIKVRKPCCNCINGGSKFCNSDWHCRDVSHIWSMLLAKYDLTKDDLSLQSPDTIDFLFKILCE